MLRSVIDRDALSVAMSVPRMSIKGVPDVSYHDLFVTRRFVCCVRVRYFGLGLGLLLVLGLCVYVRVRSQGSDWNQS